MRPFAILALTLALTSISWPVGATPVSLTLLHTNDTHDHLMPYDTKNGKHLGGIARRATLIDRIKHEASRVLVLDAGDSFQGTPLFNFFSGEPDFLGMDLAGYDASTVGNHDLDNGLANLKAQMKGRHFPLICTNLVDPVSGEPIFTGTRVFTRGGLKVGVFGLMGRDALQAVAMKNQQGFKFLEPLEVATRTVAALRKQADVVILLSHSGYDADLALAKQVTGIDVIVGGHSHTKLEHPVEVVNGAWKTLVVQDFQWGEYLGRLDLQVENGHVVSYEGKLLPITEAIAEAPKVAAAMNRYDAQISERMNVVIGQSDQGLSWENKYARDCELGDWAADVIRERGGADVGILNAGGLRASLQPGPVTVAQIFSIFPFDNALVTLDLDGATLQAMLDRAAREKPGMLQFSNLTFRVEGGKALEARVGGQPLDPTRSYKVATIDYLAQGNDGNELFLKGRNFQALGLLLRDAILDAVKAQPRIVTPTPDRIRIGS